MRYTACTPRAGFQADAMRRTGLKRNTFYKFVKEEKAKITEIT